MRICFAAILMIAVSAVTSEVCCSQEKSTARGRDGLAVEGVVSKAKDLRDAIDQCRAQLERTGNTEYAALVTEKHVKEALRQAVKDYELWLSQQPGPAAADAKYSTEIVKPLALRIADDGVYPEGCVLSWFPDALEGRANAKRGFHLRLMVVTPEARYPGFAFPLLDVTFGRWYQPGPKFGVPVSDE